MWEGLVPRRRVSCIAYKVGERRMNVTYFCKGRLKHMPETGRHRRLGAWMRLRSAASIGAVDNSALETLEVGSGS